jgi:hypothetical protein
MKGNNMSSLDTGREKIHDSKENNIPGTLKGANLKVKEKEKPDLVEMKAPDSAKRKTSDSGNAKWRVLVNSILQGDCILMLGPDAATEEVDGQQRPLTEILAEELAEEISQENKGQINTSDLAQVSECYRIENKGRGFLEVMVCEFYKKRERLTNELHENLAVLPFYFTITTTPDSMFKNALEGRGKAPIIERYNFKGENPEMIRQMGTVDNPLLYYLYGSVDKPKSLMLSESDLLDFLVRLISRKRPLPNNIRSQLHNNDKCFLFIGFGFKHWYLRLLLHMLKGRNKERCSVAMEKYITGTPHEYKQTIFFFKNSDYNIQIFNNGLNAFVEELRARYEEKYEEYKKIQGYPGEEEYTAVDIDEGKPKVFICHANEDKPNAINLYRKLEKGGLKPWIDIEDLEAGVDWDWEIETTINKKIDYFLVLQSEALAGKGIGYVNHEINIALKRQTYFKKKYKFIIPVQINNSSRLEELEHLQTIDLTNESNIGKLVTTIKRDFEKRRRNNELQR